MKSKISFRAVIPNIITIFALILGLTSIKFTMTSDFNLAIVSIVLAAILDAADGRIARLIKGTSKFGAELDSLVDFVNFGVAPALIIYFWELRYLGNIGWILTLIFIICSCLRLARFNVAISNGGKESWKDNFFTGVPTPAGAGILLIPLIYSLSDFFVYYQKNDLSLFFIIIASFLMISKVPTYAFKKIKVNKPFVILILLSFVLLFSFLITYTFNTLFVLGLIYICSIPISFFNFKILKKKYKISDNSSESVIVEDLL
jgi:CDP-diacylglycerol---serine O-phosphatidyltransferase